jgi:hypothetical protein
MSELISTMTSTGPEPVSAANPVPTRARAYCSQAGFARTADTAAYTAGDVIGTATDATAAITFADIGAAGALINIADVDLRIDVAAVPVGMTGFKLHLYNVTPPSALFDNVAWDLPAGDRAAYLGYVAIGTPVDLGSTLFVQSAGTATKQVLMGATTSLFGYLVTDGGYTPSSAAVQTVRLQTKEV